MQVKTEIQRFMEKITRSESGCWNWTASKQRNNYGQFRVGKTMALAHRWSYQHHKGLIEEGMVVDHLCSNPACVNPDHLEAVSQSENCIRAHNRIRKESN